MPSDQPTPDRLPDGTAEPDVIDLGDETGAREDEALAMFGESAQPPRFYANPAGS